MFFYHNTILVVADRFDFREFHIFNTTWGGYDCARTAPAGIVDIRNNVFAAMPRTPGSRPPATKFAYCSETNLAFGSNWVSPAVADRYLANRDRHVRPRVGDDSPGFVSTTDLHLTKGASAAGIGGALAPEVSNHSLRESLVPSLQYVPHQRVTARATSGAGSDAGAFDVAAAPNPPRSRR